jgi:hypothetical protein
MADESRYECSDDVLCQEVNGELVLLDVRQEAYFGLNPVGARVWALLREEHSEAAIVERLEQEYAVERSVLTRDVRELLDSLQQAGLLRSKP